MSASEDASAAPCSAANRSGAQEEEPRLKYGPLGVESPRASPVLAATRLAVSDKVLAVGHLNGSVQLLDHLGDQVRRHKPRVHADKGCAAGKQAGRAAGCAAAPCSLPAALQAVLPCLLLLKRGRRSKFTRNTPKR